jgi:hypothetical protein
MLIKIIKKKIINFDTSGNINLSGHTQNNNLTNGLIINGAIKGVLSQSSNNKSTGFRMWTQDAYNPNNPTYGGGWSGFYLLYSPAQLSDGTYSSFSADDWVVICVGAQFTGGDATYVSTYIQNNIWYTTVGTPNTQSKTTYKGTYMAIPKKYFEYIDKNIYST